jgi:hypothetical protein
MASQLRETSPVEWEGALIQRAQSGDTRAFERLYREHVGRVYGLCLRIAPDRSQCGAGEAPQDGPGGGERGAG